MFKAKLVEGQSYWVRGVKFEKDKEITVSKDLAEYLEELPNFEVKAEKKQKTSTTNKAGE